MVLENISEENEKTTTTTRMKTMKEGKKIASMTIETTTSKNKRGNKRTRVLTPKKTKGDGIAEIANSEPIVMCQKRFFQMFIRLCLKT